MARRRPTEPTVNPARGAALVVVAVLLGLVLLRNGIDTSEVVTPTRDASEEGTDEGTDGGDEGTDEGTDEGEETPTTAAVRPPAEVSVIVLNGTSIAGTAGKYSDAIASAGYQMIEPGNATSQTPTTLVFYTEGFEAEAVAVATAAGVPATVSPAPLTDPPPGEVGAANVVVVIGTDIASLTPTTAAADDATTETTAADG
jgi:hypothetical protein